MMRGMRPRLPHLTAFLLVAAVYLAGGLDVVEHEIGDFRFRVAERQPGTDLVVVAIDPASLKELTVWPWPRSYHARVIENLRAAGAARIAFDIDFSARSRPEQDQRLEDALARAASGGPRPGSRVVLPAFAQVQYGEAGTDLVRTEPLPRFRRHARLASINVRPDPDGPVRRIRQHDRWQGREIASLAATLAGGSISAWPEFAIDFGIDATGIPTLSYRDVLAGRFEPERVRGKRILIGATAIELYDRYPVPVYGFMSGVVIHALAYQSLVLGRALQTLGAVPTLILTGLLALALGPLFGRLSWRGGIAVVIPGGLALVAVSTAVQAAWPIQIEVAPGLALLPLLYAAGLIGRLDQQSVRLILQSLRLARTDDLMRRIVEHSFDGILILRGDGEIERANDAAAAIFKRPRDGLAGQPIATLVPGLAAGPEPFRDRLGIGRGHHEFDGAHPDGATFPCEISASEVASDDGHLFVLVVRDITERKAHQRQLEHQALHDALTGLPNRALIMDRLAKALDQARRSTEPMALLLFDLDRFKDINDTLGHNVGDTLLTKIGPRIRTCLRQGDILARLGGDEFLVLLPAATEAAEARDVARRTCQALSQVFEFGALSLEIGASVGIALYPDHGDEPLGLLQCADVAMYMAKRSQSSIALYDREKDHHSVRHLALTGELRQAIEKRQLYFLYQPKIDIASRRVVGVEALVRWQHPKHGFIAPDEFIEQAERTGLIRELTLWGLEATIGQLAEWRHAGHDLGVAFNLSTKDLLNPELPELVGRLLDGHELDPTRLTLEITESAIMQEPEEALANITALAMLGVRLSIDDYGTGHAALAYLKRLPVSELKIDKSFILNMTEDGEDAVIVGSTIELAHNLGKRVIAEGIEKEEHLRLLHMFGCDYGQGYFISRPQTAEDFIRWLAESPWGPEPEIPDLAAARSA